MNPKVNDEEIPVAVTYDGAVPILHPEIVRLLRHEGRDHTHPSIFLL